MLTRNDLWSLEEYSERRNEFRAQVIEHKKHRQVALGAHARLYFEDALTMKYQIQEMLRIEKIFVSDEIEEELAAYNPLIPNGTNLKATFMLEYPDVEQRRQALATLGGVEHKVWVQMGQTQRCYAHANDDLERTDDTNKTAAVHFLRFELAQDAIAAGKAGAPISMGIDHPRLPCEVTLDVHIASSLLSDLA